PRAQPPEHLGWRRGARLEEHPAWHDLEEVASPERALRDPDGRRELAGGVVAGVLDARAAAERRRVAGARKPGGRDAVDGKLVVLAPCDPSRVVDDDEPIGQEEHQVARGRIARQAVRDRLELEREVVAERAVETEVAFLGAVEEVDERAHDAEHGALLRPLLLREPLARLADGPAHARSVGAEVLEGVDGLKAPRDRREEDA